MMDWTRKSVTSVNQQLRIFRERSASLPDVVTEGFLTRTRIIGSAGIALSIIILQAFISTGVSKPFAFISVLFFSLSLPMQALLMFITSGMTVLKPTRPSNILKFIYFVGNTSCLIGVLAAFSYISLYAGFVFSLSCAIVIPLYFYHAILIEKSDGIDD